MTVFWPRRGIPRVTAIAVEMEKELGGKGAESTFLLKLARLEVALLEFHENNLGDSSYAVFANKCWPAFEKYFGCVPCFVNSRLAARGIPVACEVDIYGALSQYMLAAATQAPTTLLDINNTVPPDMQQRSGRVLGPTARPTCSWASTAGTRPRVAFWISASSTS